MQTLRCHELASVMEIIECVCSTMLQKELKLEPVSLFSESQSRINCEVATVTGAVFTNHFPV